MKLADIPELRDSSAAAKLELVEELWAAITAQSDSFPLPAWHVRALDQSLADFQADPLEGSPWPDARARILARRTSS
ncbi:MAG: addiction module protein [Undibacterium sp.]|nr:addiction module protein [Opitutaceae bacterium]